MRMSGTRKRAHGLPCPYCGRQMDLRNAKLIPTRDHVIPRCRGGTELVICCITCNTIKADMLPDQWRAYMTANPDWWLLTRAERRARARANREDVRTEKWGPRRHGRQGTPPAKPVVVPAHLIYDLSSWPPAPE